MAVPPSSGVRLVYGDNSNVALPSPTAYQPSENHGINIWAIVGILRRRWLYAIFGCLIGLVAGASYIALSPSLYKSSARILIDKSVNRYLQAHKITEDPPPFDDMEIGSQIYVLTSDSIIVPVVRTFNLAHDAEFVGLLGTPRVETESGLQRIKTIIKRFIGSDEAL